MSMRVSKIAAALAAVSAAALTAGAAQAGPTLTPIPSYVDPQGGGTSVLGVNDSGWMTGSIGYSDGSKLGFIRTPGGVYTTFSTGAFATEGRAIDESENISGYATDNTFNQQTDQEFLRAPGGAITSLQNPTDMSFLHGIAQGMNSLGDLVGDWYHVVSGNLVHTGYILNGPSFTDLSIPGFPNDRVAARGINSAGEVTGWFVQGGVTEGFLWNGGSFTFVSDPNAVNGTFLEDLNNHGIASGEWNDALGKGHAFEYNTHTGQFTEINVPGATSASAFGLDDFGNVVITTDIAVGPNNFLFNAGVPQPAGWGLMLVGAFSLGAALRRRRGALRAA